MTSERVCYVQCNFCSTILAVWASESEKSSTFIPMMMINSIFFVYMVFYDFVPVSVPSSSMYSIVTVRCGHCANLLSVNMGGLIHSLYLHQNQQSVTLDHGASSSSNYCSIFAPLQLQQKPTTPPIIRHPEKRQRVPSAYNRFIKEEIQRIKASNAEIAHREAFSAAAKN